MRRIEYVHIIKGCIVTSGTLLKAGFALMCGKIAAMALGPAEFADFGQYLLVFTALQGVCSLGLANAHVVYFAKSVQTGTDQINRDAAYLLAIVGGASVGIATIAVLSISPAFVSHMPPFPLWLRALLFLYCVLTPIVVAKAAELNASGHLFSQQLLGISTPFVQLCTLLLLIYCNALMPAEAAAAYCAGFILVGLPLALTKFRSRNLQTIKLAGAWKHYGRLVVPSLSAPLIASIATITAFNVIRSCLSPEHAGVWFALWRLAEAYHGIIIAIGATLFLPKLARAGTRIRAVAVRLLLVMLLLYMPWAIALLCFPEKTISLVFSQEFSSHLPNLLAQVLGDMFKIVCSTCILVYISISRPRVIVVGELFFGLVFVSLLAFGIQGHGLGRCLAIYAISCATLAAVMILTLAFLLRNRRV